MIEIAVTVLIYIVALMIFIGGIAFIASKFPSSHKTPKLYRGNVAPVFTTKTTTFNVSKDISDEELEKLFKEQEDNVVPDGMFSSVTVTRKPASTQS